MVVWLIFLSCMASERTNDDMKRVRVRVDMSKYMHQNYKTLFSALSIGDKYSHEVGDSAELVSPSRPWLLA